MEPGDVTAVYRTKLTPSPPAPSSGPAGTGNAAHRCKNESMDKEKHHQLFGKYDSKSAELERPSVQGGHRPERRTDRDMRTQLSPDVRSIRG
ncbi:unnamed protein product [Arctogadus glacialis]